MFDLQFIKYTIVASGLISVLTMSAGNDIRVECNRIVSALEDPTPAQIAGGTVPAKAAEIYWQRPAIAVYKVNFAGTNGIAASHEGVDYVQNDQLVVEVVIRAAADGKVEYVREGCEQSSMFTHNNTGRESGAGWGNHIVLSHKSVLYTRYGHLLKNSILVNVGDSVKAGQIIAKMGNSGRSETRHLHFELGTKITAFNACAMSQNFDRVYNSETLVFQSPVSDIKTINLSDQIIRIAPNPIMNGFTLSTKYSLGNNAAVSIYDIAARKLNCIVETSRTDYTRTYELTKALHSGIYFLIVNENNNQQVMKINIATN